MDMPTATASLPATANFGPDDSTVTEETKAQVAAALAELGVTEETLSEEEKASIDRVGYCVMRNVISREEAAVFAQHLDALAAKEGEDAGKDWQVEKGATRIGYLIDKDPIFDRLTFHPRALAAVNYILKGNMGLSSVTARAAMPGEGHQGFHRDSGDNACGNALWVLSDFTEKNGPTRLIPSSHHWTPAEAQAIDHQGPHKDQIRVIAPAGSLIVINGLLLHGGTRNETEKPRHCCHSFFTMRDRYQAIPRKMTPATAQRLSTAQKVILDYAEPDAA